MAKVDANPLTTAQREIMEIVWQNGEVTVAEVRVELATKRKIARNTVQTMMVRLLNRSASCPVTPSKRMNGRYNITVIHPVPPAPSASAHNPPSTTLSSRAPRSRLSLIAPHVIVASSAVNPPRCRGCFCLAVEFIGMQGSWR